MAFYVDVILPFPVHGFYTYQINPQQADFLKTGMRVFVSFGKSRKYTAVVYAIHQQKPVYEVKEIECILDENPILTPQQIDFFLWVSSYYMCPVGEVLKFGLPSSFLLESQMLVQRTEQEVDLNQLSDNEYLIYEALSDNQTLSIEKITKIISKKNVIKELKSLVDKNVISLIEKIYQKYKPKMLRYVCIDNQGDTEKTSDKILEKVSLRATEQRKLIQNYFLIKKENNFVLASELLKKSNVSLQILSTLIKKDIFKEVYLQTDRVSFSGEATQKNHLNEIQTAVYEQLTEKILSESAVLLHSDFSFPKTEIYIKFIKEEISKGKQVLLLLPEIASVIQWEERLKNVFGEQMSVYHLKNSSNERREVWNNLLENKEKTKIIIGMKSALFLPFSSLGLVIVEQEHDVSYRSQEFQFRDVALVLAKKHQAKVLLQSETPSAETFHHFASLKKSYVSVNEIVTENNLPEINLIDLKNKVKENQMIGHFSDVLINEINENLNQKKQIIIFQNRRGYAPFLQCNHCSDIPHCQNCDVSLTFHKGINELRCHYCGYSEPYLASCRVCKSTDIAQRGVGTEQIHQELLELFPNAKIDRMDKDTTSGKYAYNEIITRFEQGKTDILIGTQMINSIDFQNVSLVGVINADLLINQPDFRAVERSFQFLTQLAGRVKNSDTKGKIMIQTYNPNQKVLRQVVDYQYNMMINEQISEREIFHYPPFFRLIQIVFKHQNLQKINKGADWFANVIRSGFASSGIEVLGAEFAPISKVRNEYIKQIMLKIPNKISYSQVKKYLHQIEKSFQSISEFRSIRLIFRVDI